MEFDGLSRKVIGSAIEVHRQLGPGLLETAYEQCLCYELSARGLAFERQAALPVRYKSVVLDGKSTNIGVTTVSSDALGWGPSLIANVQVDPPSGSGSSHIFVDNMAVYRW